MFSLQIVDSDAFLEMPASSQAYYFHLAMRGDDDGFVANPKKILKMVGAQEDDYKILIAKRFVLAFESGVVVIKHWRMHNYIQNDRYHETNYQEEMKVLTVKSNGSYTERIQNGYKVDTEVRLGKDRLELGKDSIEIGEITPSTEALNFFSDQSSQNEITKKMVEKLKCDEALIKNELTKFIFYWTEKNKSGTKCRWQLERTFEVSRRLYTWFSNYNKFSGKLPQVKTWGEAVKI